MSGPWLNELTPVQRARVHEIMDEHLVTFGGTKQRPRGLWIKQSPSTGRCPTDVVLLLKSKDGAVLCEWRIWPREGDPRYPPDVKHAAKAAHNKKPVVAA